MASNYAQLSCCPRDGEPLVSDISVPKKEWRCMVCGSFYEFFGARIRTGTPELNARYDELLAADRGEA